MSRFSIPGANAPGYTLSPLRGFLGLPDGFEAGVLEDEGFAADVLEVDDGAGVLAHVGDVGDAADAELGVADELAAAELGGEAGGFEFGLGALGVAGGVEVGAGGVDDVEEFVGEFGEEAGGDGALAEAADGAVGGAGEEQLLLGAGDADEAEAAFFLELFGVLGDAGVGEDVFLQADHGDDGEFEAFGGVEGHEGDGAAVFVDHVGVGDEGDLGEVVFEVAVGVFLVELGGGGDEFVDVGQFGFVLVGGFAEVGFVAGGFEDVFHEGLDAALGGRAIGAE